MLLELVVFPIQDRATLLYLQLFSVDECSYMLLCDTAQRVWLLKLAPSYRPYLASLLELPVLPAAMDVAHEANLLSPPAHAHVWRPRWNSLLRPVHMWGKEHICPCMTRLVTRVWRAGTGQAALASLFSVLQSPSEVTNSSFIHM